MELSEEMKEAMRILREDGQIASFNKMTNAQQELVSRLDEIENNWSEFRASQNEPKDNGTVSDPPVSNAPDDGPQPPPVVEPTPEPVAKGRLHWWERDGYASN
jgi:hypothetical protein